MKIEEIKNQIKTRIEAMSRPDYSIWKIGMIDQPTRDRLANHYACLTSWEIDSQSQADEILAHFVDQNSGSRGCMEAGRMIQSDWKSKMHVYIYQAYPVNA